MVDVFGVLDYGDAADLEAAVATRAEDIAGCGSTASRDVRRSMDAGTVEALSDPLVQLIIDEVIECLGESESARAHSLGVSALLRQPEFSDSKALLPVIEVLEDDRVLLNTFDEAAAEGGPVMVRIGHENPASELAGVSIVACPYGRGESEGVVAVAGISDAEEEVHSN